MALINLLLLLIGLCSTSAQVPHCVPCTEPFQQFDYNIACDELQNTTVHIDQQQLIAPVFVIRDKLLERKNSFCVPCGDSLLNFDASCEDFRRFHESERIKNINLCNEENNEIFFDGQCHILLEQGPCPENHWLVINNKTTGPVCEYNKCFDSTSLFVKYKGLCLNLSSEYGFICGNDKVLVVSTDGTADCECSDEMVQLPNTEECFTTRQKTSQCAPNWVLEKSPEGNPVCVRNFCSDGEIYLHGQCWPLSPHCRVGRSIDSNTNSSDFNNPENTFSCKTFLEGGGEPLSDSQNAKPITNCPRNAARIEGKCPIFSMQKKLPFV